VSIAVHRGVALKPTEVSGRRGLQRPRLLIQLVLFGLQAAACEDGSRATVPFDDNVSLFVPGSVGMPRVQSSRTGAAGGGDEDGGECMGINTPVSFATAGKQPAECLVVELQTDGPPGDYDKAPGERANNGVIWIEDSSGGYVTGLESWADHYAFSTQRTWLFTKERFNCPDPDIIASATLHAHEVHRLTWECQDTAGNVVPDGNYLLWVDVQVDEKHRQAAVALPFVKGGEPYTTMASPAPAVKSATLMFTPIP